MSYNDWSPFGEHIPVYHIKKQAIAWNKQCLIHFRWWYTDNAKMIGGLFIYNHKGEVLISRVYRDDIG